MMQGPIAYIGGKSRLAETLLPLFPPHHTYVEPFCGAAHLFFQKEPSPVEVLNDLDGELVNFLRVCQLHHQELVRWLKFTVTSRRLFEMYQKQEPSALTDVQRAVRFLYLQKTTWAGKVRGQTFNYRVSRPGRYFETSVEETIAEAAKRLERVQLENWPYERVLERYDTRHTFFYCDPPYIEQPYYNFNFSPDDFGRLAEGLGRLKGRFLLSMNDHPRARAIFAPFRRRALSSYGSLGRSKCGHRSLLFANFDV